MSQFRWRRAGIPCLALVAVLAGSDADAQEFAPPQLAAVDALLGGGVVGAPIAASPIVDTTTLLPLAAGTRTYQVSAGPNQGSTETDVLQAAEPGAAAPWKYTAGQSTIYAIATTADGSIVSASEQDLSQGVLTTYTPPRPVLVPNMQPGVPLTTTLQVAVSDLSDPGTVTHTGTLTQTTTYLGRYQVTVPAGTYSAALVEWQFNGQVGPASVTDVEYRFFADGVGPVAVIDRQSVSAFLLYNSNTKFGKVLAGTGG